MFDWNIRSPNVYRSPMMKVRLDLVFGHVGERKIAVLVRGREDRFPAIHAPAVVGLHERVVLMINVGRIVQSQPAAVRPALAWSFPFERYPRPEIR